MATDKILQAVRLSPKEWRNIAILLITSLGGVAGVTYGMASRIIETKAQEIKQSVDRITMLESQMRMVDLNQKNLADQQHDMLVEIRSGNSKVNEISVSLARIEGRMQPQNQK